MLRRLLQRSAGPGPMVVSYTPGKVGGTALVRAAQAAGLECHQVHQLRREALMTSAGRSIEAGDLPLRNISIAMALRDEIVNRKRDLRIVTAVRDPLEQSLSAFFQNLHHRTDGLTKDSPPEALFEQWIKGARVVWAMGWLDFELKAELGIDVLAHPFDRDRRIAEVPGADLMVMRVDCPTEVKERELSRFLGRRIRLGRANVGAEKPYSAAYRAVQGIAKAPDKVIEAVYETDYMRHFWTEEERQALIAKWRGGQA